MNAFVKHHRDAIRFDYSCFDRMILAGYIQGLQVPGQVVSFLRDRREMSRLSRSYFAGVSQNFRVQVEKLATDQGLDILEPERATCRAPNLISKFCASPASPPSSKGVNPNASSSTNMASTWK